MNLHRVTADADWARQNPEHHNDWQRLAVRTQGIITPGNMLTIVGFAIGVAGLLFLLIHAYLIGAVCLAVGRLLDIADGLAADKTGTKSPLGESLDAGFDKLITVMTVAVLYYVGGNLWPVLTIIFVPQLAIVAVTFWLRRQKIRLHPSRYGKFSMAFAWAGLLDIVLALESQGGVRTIIVVIAYVIAVISALNGALAYRSYVADWRRQTK